MRWCSLDESLSFANQVYTVRLIFTYRPFLRFEDFGTRHTFRVKHSHQRCDRTAGRVVILPTYQPRTSINNKGLQRTQHTKKTQHPEESTYENHITHIESLSIHTTHTAPQPPRFRHTSGHPSTPTQYFPSTQHHTHEHKHNHGLRLQQTKGLRLRPNLRPRRPPSPPSPSA
jgi:hypothetical protein